MGKELRKACTVVPPGPQFCFMQFQLPTANCDPKILNGKFKKETTAVS